MSARVAPLRALASRVVRARMRLLPLSDFERDFAVVEPYTMLGVRRLKSLHAGVTDAARRGIPGDVVECGVARGGSALLMALALREAGASRTLWLFDTFEGLPEPSREGDPDYEVARHLTGACRGTEDEVRAVLGRHCPTQRAELVKGLFADTLPGAGVGSIAVLHLDGDWYESVKACLENLWDRVSPGGLVQVDDYFTWAGCKRAVDEFFRGDLPWITRSRGAELRLERVDASGVRMRKPGAPSVSAT